MGPFRTPRERDSISGEMQMNATIMKGERSKLLAVAVVFAMFACALVAFMPTSDAVDAPEPDTTVADLEDLQSALEIEGYDVIEVSGGITLDETTKLDLNEKTIIVPYNGLGSIYLNGGSLSNGTIYGNGGNIVNVVSGTISSVTFQDFNIAVSNNILCLGVLNVSGCKFVVADGEESCNAIYLNLDTDTADVTITGCEFTGKYTENNLNLAMYDGFDNTKVTVNNSNVSINVYGPQGTDSETQMVIGENLVLGEGTTVSNINMTQVGASSGSPQGTAPAISVPAGSQLEVETITGSGTISAEDVGSVIYEESDVPVIDATTGAFTVTTFDEFKAALSNGASKSITLDADITFTENLINQGIVGKTIDLNGNSIILGTYEFHVTDSIIGNGKITSEGGTVNQLISVYGNTAFDNVDFYMGADSEGDIRPFILLLQYGANVNISSCSFDAETDGYFGAVQASDNNGINNSTVIKDCTTNNGIVVYKNSPNEKGKSTMSIESTQDVILSLTGNTDMSGITVDSDSSVAKTILGFDASTSNNGNAAVKDMTVTVTKDFDFGVMHIAEGGDTNKKLEIVVNGGNATAEGGEGVDKLTIGEKGTFTAGENGFSVYQISAQNPDQIIGHVYVGDGGVQLPSTSGKPTADNFYVAFNTKQCYNGDSQIPDISVYGPSNIVGQVTILTDMEQFALTDVSEGTMDVRITVSFSYTINGVVQEGETTAEGGQGVGTQVTLRFSWSLAPAEPTLEITVPEWYFGDEDKAASAVANGVDGQPLDGGVYDYIYMQNGVEVDPDKLGVGSATVYVTYTPDETNTNYTAVTDYKTFTVGNAQLDISVETPSQNGWFDENVPAYGQVSDYVGPDFSVTEIVPTAENPEPDFDYAGETVYFMGPCPAVKGQVMGSCGPTTSGRMDKYTPYMFDHGLAAQIGKGKRSPECIEAIKRNGGAYFAAIGGAGALYSGTVTAVEEICYPDLGTEAVRRITVRDFPAIVAIDSEGNCIYAD